MMMIRSGKVYKSISLVLITTLFFLGSLKAWDFILTKMYPKQKYVVTGLVYHRFGDQRYPSTNTTVESLEQQLQWLKQNGYVSYTASDIVDLKPGEEVAHKAVCITIDDGYKSFKEHGWPVFQKYGMKATLFVNTESVGWADYLTWDDLKVLASEGVEIGNHSHSHAYFLNHPSDEVALHFAADLQLAAGLFVKNLGAKPTVYAYPYGEFIEPMAHVLKTQGIKAAFAQNSGVWSDASNPYTIPRFPMSGHVTLKRFEEKMKMQPLPLLVDNDYPIIRKEKAPNTFIFDVDAAYFPGPFNGFINGSSTMVNQANKRFEVVLNQKEPKRRSLLTITTRDKNGSWCWYSKLFVNPDIPE